MTSRRDCASGSDLLSFRSRLVSAGRRRRTEAGNPRGWPVVQDEVVTKRFESPRHGQQVAEGAGATG